MEPPPKIKRSGKKKKMAKKKLTGHERAFPMRKITDIKTVRNEIRFSIDLYCQKEVFMVKTMIYNENT